MKHLALLLLSFSLFSCASKGDSTGYPFCDEGKHTQKSLLNLYQAYLSDPALKMELTMERKRYDAQVQECEMESGEKGILSSTGDLLCGNDAQCKTQFK